MLSQRACVYRHSTAAVWPSSAGRMLPMVHPTRCTTSPCAPLLHACLAGALQRCTWSRQIVSVCGPICSINLMVFPAVPGPPSVGDTKATGAQAGEEEDPPEDMEVDPNPAGKGLRPLRGLGVRSAGSPPCGKSTVALAVAAGIRPTILGLAVQHSSSWRPPAPQICYVLTHIVSLGSCWHLDRTSPVR